MASEREAAKQSASDEEASDPQLTTQLQESASFRLEQTKEDHRHTETLHRQKLGWFGKFLGGAETAPVVVAFIALLLFSTVGVGCLGAAFWNGNPPVLPGVDLELHATEVANAKSAAVFWGDNARNAFAVALSALGYIFGRGSKAD